MTRGWRWVVRNSFRKKRIAAKRSRFGCTRMSMTAPVNEWAAQHIEQPSHCPPSPSHDAQKLCGRSPTGVVLGLEGSDDRRFVRDQKLPKLTDCAARDMGWSYPD